MKAIAKLVLCAIGTSAFAQDLPTEDRLVRLESGVDVQSLEDAARTYLSQIAYIDKNFPSQSVQVSAKDVLRDRDGLTESEALEIIEVARRMDDSDADTIVAGEKFGKLCADLHAAETREEKLAVLEGSEARSRAENRLKGANALERFRPSTRVHLIRAVTEFRKNTTVSSIQWPEARPEQLAAFQQRMCGPTN